MGYPLPSSPGVLWDEVGDPPQFWGQETQKTCFRRELDGFSVGIYKGSKMAKSRVWHHYN